MCMRACTRLREPSIDTHPETCGSTVSHTSASCRGVRCTPRTASPYPISSYVSEPCIYVVHACMCVCVCVRARARARVETHIPCPQKLRQITAQACRHLVQVKTEREVSNLRKSSVKRRLRCSETVCARNLAPTCRRSVMRCCDAVGWTCRTSRGLTRPNYICVCRYVCIQVCSCECASVRVCVCACVRPRRRPAGFAADSRA